ncbi:hypothetical protein BJQ90_01619 [Arthrobacter sp. SO3]|nr:hypothetical protein [Arthrobacter sp. SO3]
MEDLVRRRVVRADGSPCAAGGAGLEGDLVEGVAADVGRHPDAAVVGGSCRRILQRHGGGCLGVRDAARGLVDDGGKRRHRYRQSPVRCGLDLGVRLPVDPAERPLADIGWHGSRLWLFAVIDGDHVLALVLGVGPGEGVNARPVGGVAVLVRAVPQCEVLLRQRRELADVAVQRVGGVEIVARMGRVGAEQIIVEVVRDLAGKQRLAGILVPAGAGEALFVAVVDHRIAAGEVHQLVGEPVPGNAFGVVRARVVRGDEAADPAHVVVAEEGGQFVDVGVRVGVPVVPGEEGLKALGRLAPGREVARRVLEREIQHGLHLVAGGELRGEALGGVEDLAEHKEVVLAMGFGVLEDLGAELLPELVVDMLHGVDPEAVHTEVADPLLIDVDHAVDNPWLLCEQVIEAEEVPVGGVFAFKGSVAAVVIERGVVEPGGDFEVLFPGRQLRRVGEGRRRVQGREAVRSGVVTVVERDPGGSQVGGGVLGFVGGALALLVADYVRGVVGDDVEVDLHAAGMGLVDECFELVVGAQVRIDLGEVGDPVAVVPGRLVLRLDRFVLEARGQPDRSGSKALDVVDLVPQAFEVPAVVEALFSRVKAGDHRVRPQTAVVVGAAAVVEPVGHHEVELLVRHRAAERVGGRRPGRVRRGPRCLRREDDRCRGNERRRHGGAGGKECGKPLPVAACGLFAQAGTADQHGGRPSGKRRCLCEG